MEYWIANWRTRQIEIYRRDEAALKQAKTVYAEDTLQSPYPPGFRCQVREVFSSIVQ